MSTRIHMIHETSDSEVCCSKPSSTEQTNPRFIIEIDGLIYYYFRQHNAMMYILPACWLVFKKIDRFVMD